MATKKDLPGEDKRFSKIAKKESRLFLWQKDIKEFKRCQPKGPPLTPKCSHTRDGMECDRVSQEDVELFYNRFYQAQDRSMQDLMIMKHCEVREAGGSRTRSTFYLPMDGGRTRVCKAAFAGALGVGVARIEKVLRNARQHLRQEVSCPESTIPKKKVTFAKENDYRHYNTNNSNITSPLGDLDSLSSSDDIFNNTFNITFKRISKSDLSCTKVDECSLEEQSCEDSPSSIELYKFKELQVNSEKSSGIMINQNNQFSSSSVLNEQNNLEYVAPRLSRDILFEDLRMCLITESNQNTSQDMQETPIVFAKENSKDKFIGEFSISSEAPSNSHSQVVYSTPKRPHSGRFLPHIEFSWSDLKGTPKISTNKNKIKQRYPISFDWSDPKPTPKIVLNESTPVRYGTKSNFDIESNELNNRNCPFNETEFILSNSEKHSNLDLKDISNKRKSLSVLTNVIHDIENLTLKDQETRFVQKKKFTAQDKENMQTQVCSDKSSCITIEKENDNDKFKKFTNVPPKILRRLGKRNVTTRRANGTVCSPVVLKPKIVL